MADNLLKSSWLWIGYSKEMLSGELLHIKSHINMADWCAYFAAHLYWIKHWHTGGPGPAGLQLWRCSTCQLWVCKWVQILESSLGSGEAEKERWLAGELLHHLTFLKLLNIINLSLIDVTCLTGSARQLQRTIADAWAQGRASSLLILNGEKSFHLLLGLMLFNPGGVDSNFIALKGAWQCCHKLVLIDVPCVTGGARQLQSWTNLGLYRKWTADNSRRLDPR